MNPKHSLVFFSAGVILILVLFLMGVPMSMVPAAQQQQEQNEWLDLALPSKVNNDKLNTGKIIVTMETEKTKPLDEMDCIELREFAMSFEKGWGSAIPLHDERCS